MKIQHIFRRITLVFLLTTLLPSVGVQCFTASAQMDPDAVQPAMAELLRRHSTSADTIAKEISSRFFNSAPMQMALARAYYRNNERQKTRYYLKKAMAADPNFTPAYIMYGDLYGEWQVDSASYWFERAVEANPKVPEGYVKYANVMARRDMDKALAKLEELRKAVPTYNVDVEISALYNKKGDDKAAVAALQNVDPETLTMNQLAQYMQNCYWSTYDERAMEVGLIAMRRFPENRGFNRVYAWSAVRSERYDEAFNNAKQWLEKAPTDSVNSIDYLAIGTACVGLGKYEEAFGYLARINDLKDDYFAPQMPKQITQLVNRNVEALKDRGDYEKAADLYSRYIKAYPSDSDPAYQYYTLAQIYRAQQEELDGEQRKEVIKKMFKVYDIIEEKYPDWSNIHYVLYTHARWTYSFFDPENEQSLALPYYQRLYDVLEKREKLSEQENTMIVEACQYTASDSYFQKHDVAKARLWWARILKYNPTNQAAKDALEKIKE
ncbi:MAG: tetratricopeptide repeat protein [Prevotella sp.]|nr:tetratricopeptide repeat protein [Prevotella sp.]